MASQKADQAVENRKLRNRLSQKAYRARQCMRIKELEERLDSNPLGENTRVKELEDQNQQLRDQLLSCHKKMASLSLSMQALADAAATSLGIQASTKPCKATSNYPDPNAASNEEGSTLPDEADNDDQTNENLKHQGTVSIHDEEASVPTADDAYLNLGLYTPSPAQPIDFPRSQELAPWSGTSTPKPFNFENNFRDSTSPSAHIFASASSFTYQSMGPFSQLTLPSYAGMGGMSYANTVSKAPLLIRGPHNELYKSNSLFSDHIAVVEHFLKQKWSSPQSLLKYGEEGLANSVSFMLSVFVCMSWSVMTSWHTYTRAHVPLKRLHIWRLNPTAQSYMKMDSWYRPTQIQLSIPHPSIIDWMPWPAVRDKLILYHAANPRLDEVICDIGNNYVMECDLSEFVANIRPMRGLIGVFDLVRSIAPTATSESAQDFFPGELDPDFNADSSSPTSSITDTDDAMDTACLLPAPNVDALFGSKSFALQAFKALGCDKGANLFKLDPEFFKMHPELYDPMADLMANGVMRLRPPHPKSISLPRPLDPSMLGRYRELSTWSFDLSFFQTDAAAGA